MKEYIKPTVELIVFDIKTLITNDGGPMLSGGWEEGDEI